MVRELSRSPKVRPLPCELPGLRLLQAPAERSQSFLIVIEPGFPLRDAVAEFNAAIDMLQAANSRKTKFGQQKLRDVPFPSPQTHFVDLNYYMGISYYFLYRYGEYTGDDPEVLRSYKQNSRNGLQLYRKLGKNKNRLEEVDTFMAELNQ